MSEPKHSAERISRPISGWLMVVAVPLWDLFAAWYVISRAKAASDDGSMTGLGIALMVLIVLSVPVSLFLLNGCFIVKPNMSRVLVLFGHYKGTAREEGFFWVNPFTWKFPVSLRARNVASETIKVNDLSGNPIEIGAVVVWKVEDTAQASFDVDDYEHYVDVQIETAVRDLAKQHPYDDNQGEGEVVSLRGDTAEVQQKLESELQRRLNRAGIQVLEARISHLAYAQEIASAMLQRQQAEAVVAAREKIVEGAVGMVEHALEDLASKGVVDLDDERKAVMVSNLLVVLCGQAPATPVVNTGTLYS